MNQALTITGAGLELRGDATCYDSVAGPVVKFGDVDLVVAIARRWPGIVKLGEVKITVEVMDEAFDEWETR